VAKFNRRSDFRLLQKLTFSGYGTEIPNGTYRIVGISYEYSNGGLTNIVTCTLVLDSQFKFYLNLNRVFTDSVSEMQSIVQDKLDKIGKSDTGTFVRYDDNDYAVIDMDDGRQLTVRDGTAT
jgi:hypothetical protein